MRTRIEVLAGPQQGRVLDEVDEMTLWTPKTWAAAVEASPFRQVATCDGSRLGLRKRISADAVGGLLWHELVTE
jgi:hypothetical protein